MSTVRQLGVVHVSKLAKQLEKTPPATQGVAYHITHGVRLRSIQKGGLLPGLPGVQYVTGKLFFTTNLKSSINAYGKDIIESIPRQSGHHWLERWSYMYYQGVAVLRMNICDLQSLGYQQVNGYDFSGDKSICPSKIDLFIDGRWEKLTPANLEYSWFWYAIYWATPFLRK